MVRKIKINCKKVYDTGVAYENNANEIKRMQIRLNNISDNIKLSWHGVDSNNFIARLNSQIVELDKIINFLNNKGALLKSNAINHSTVDSDFLSRIRRSDMNE